MNQLQDILKVQRQHFDNLLAGNKLFLEEKTKENAQYFEQFKNYQWPHTMVITCCDSRIPTNLITKSDLCELFIHRNVANQICDDDYTVLASICFAINVVKIQSIVIIGHTSCGGIKAILDDEVPEGSVIEKCIKNIQSKYKQVKNQLAQYESFDKLTKMAELNLKEQMKNALNNVDVLNSWKNGNPINVFGAIQHVGTGLLEEIKLDNEDKKELNPFYEKIL